AGWSCRNAFGRPRYPSSACGVETAPVEQPGGTLVHPLRVVGVRVELPANQPVVLLREEDGVRYLPIWIGAVEASAIAFQQQGVQTVRPLAHDLMRDVIKALGVRLEAVHITELRDDVFYAELRFNVGGSGSAPPSGASPLAPRAAVPILAP